MTLDQCVRGSEVQIVSINDPAHRDQLVRLGISGGARVVCQEKLPFGPLVIRCNRQEIAVGRKLARRIVVRRYIGALQR